MLKLKFQPFGHLKLRTDTGKDPNAGKDWRQEKGMAEDEMVGWYHWFNEHEFEQTPRVSDGQGGLVCWSLWGGKESDTTEWLNWTKLTLLKVSSQGWVLTSSRVQVRTGWVLAHHSWAGGQMSRTMPQGLTGGEGPLLRMKQGQEADLMGTGSSGQGLWRRAISDRRECGVLARGVWLLPRSVCPPTLFSWRTSLFPSCWGSCWRMVCHVLIPGPQGGLWCRLVSLITQPIEKDKSSQGAKVQLGHWDTSTSNFIHIESKEYLFWQGAC